MFNDVYRDRTVLVTGHTGFKGSWLCLWLQELGAKVSGYALHPDSPSHFSMLDLKLNSCFSDICDYSRLEDFMRIIRPEIVFHLAAQPLVRQSYRSPRETFEVNVQGTVNLLEACRQVDSVRAVVVITTDKCYANSNSGLPFKEDDRLGGHDPYSASKAASELVAASYREAFFRPDGRVALATARAGNVIGGGDWAAERLVPDLMRAAERGETAIIRSPNAIRPWQHVLEPLAGYLLLGEKLLCGRGQGEWDTAWNFGPASLEPFTVLDVVRMAQGVWPKLQFAVDESAAAAFTEASRLVLDSGRARKKLGWHPVWDTQESVRRTVRWYQAKCMGRILSQEDLTEYCDAARRNSQEWAKD